MADEFNNLPVTTCALCGGEPAHAHHLTGRPAPRQPYLDPQLTIGVCQRHHVMWHVGMRAVGVVWPRPLRLPVAYRLRLVSFHLRSLGTAGRPFVLGATSTLALADLIDEAAAFIESEPESEPESDRIDEKELFI